MVTRYVHGFQSRRSLLVWKLFGRRLDGFPEAPVKGYEPHHKSLEGEPFKGSVMPPPDAVKAGKAKPLSDEDRRTIIRWIDLGCPVDLDFDAKSLEKRGFGWMFDDQRPTLTLTYPKAGVNEPLSRIVVGMHGYGSGLELDRFEAGGVFNVHG